MPHCQPGLAKTAEPGKERRQLTDKNPTPLFPRSLVRGGNSQAGCDRTQRQSASRQPNGPGSAASRGWLAARICTPRFAEPTVRRLSPGAEWIRTFSSALDRQQFVVSSESGPIYRRTIIRAVAGLGEPIELSGGVPSAVTHRPDQATSHQGRAVGGASASRNRRFESAFLQR